MANIKDHSWNKTLCKHCFQLKVGNKLILFYDICGIFIIAYPRITTYQCKKYKNQTGSNCIYD